MNKKIPFLIALITILFLAGIVVVLIFSMQEKEESETVELISEEKDEKEIKINIPFPSSYSRVVISGLINIKEKTAKISPLINADNLEISQESPDSRSQLRFISIEDEVLKIFDFKLGESELPESHLIGGFFVIIDLPEGTAIIEVLIDGKVVDSLSYTGYGPEINILTPVAGELVGEEINISWIVLAGNNDKLTYTVEFSNDNGESWDILAMYINKTEITMPTHYLGGGDSCLVKITAFDGGDKSEKISSPFVVAKKLPIIEVQEPKPNTVIMGAFKPTQGRVTAWDPQTGYNISDHDAFLWESNIDGELGYGQLIGFELSVGDHELSITVTNSEGESSVVKIPVKVMGRQ